MVNGTKYCASYWSVKNVNANEIKVKDKSRHSNDYYLALACCRTGACHNKECPFLHIDPETKIKDCPWYDRGFCRHGPTCRHRHVRRVLCMNYTAGFCPDGAECKFVQCVSTCVVLSVLVHFPADFVVHFAFFLAFFFSEHYLVLTRTSSFCN